LIKEDKAESGFISFGLSFVQKVPEGDLVVFPEHNYDPVRQVSTRLGTPVMGGDGDEDNSGENPGTTHSWTRYDHQHETDAD